MQTAQEPPKTTTVNVLFQQHSLPKPVCCSSVLLICAAHIHLVTIMLLYTTNCWLESRPRSCTSLSSAACLQHERRPFPTCLTGKLDKTLYKPTSLPQKPHKFVHCRAASQSSSPQQPSPPPPAWLETLWTVLVPKVVFGIINLPLIVLRSIVGFPFLMAAVIMRYAWVLSVWRVLREWHMSTRALHHYVYHSNAPVWTAQGVAFVKEAIEYVPRFTGPSWKVWRNVMLVMQAYAGIKNMCWNGTMPWAMMCSCTAQNAQGPTPVVMQLSTHHQDVLRTSVLVLMATMGLMVWINTLDTVFFKLSRHVAAIKAGGV